VDAHWSTDLILALAVVVFGAAGTYLLLPHRHGWAKPRSVHAVGGGLAALALLLFAACWKPPDPWLTGFFFYAFSLATVACAIMTVTSRNPVYSALWFASVVLSTSGLFLLAGAQFLAAGTVIVYAGAIIVTFLFVIMLAQMEGRALYDRAARAPALATISSFLIFWGVLYSLFLIRPPARPPVGSAVIAGDGQAATSTTDRRLARPSGLATAVLAPAPKAGVVERAVRTSARFTDAEGRPKPHVAGLGETLFTDHLVTVELAGALLFVALIGALAIATPRRPIRPGDRADVAAAPNA
jgi:NADH-quinone oxidoreductase subunit J